MTRRANQNDTAADIRLYECLNSSPPRSFLMIAGAGSGKTTSLIKGLSEALKKHGKKLKLRRQRIACITYTEIAAGEIWADVGNNALVHVATIHSFLWSLVRSFQGDIQKWVAQRIDTKVAELRETAANFGPRVQQRTRDKNAADIARYEQQKARIANVRSFTYGAGSDYANGILGHDDIINMVPQFIAERPLMRKLVAQQYPIIFVDESQDTFQNVVLALKAIDHDCGDQFCLGFFGDPMQRIYVTGVGNIPPEPGWVTITKDENFRCPTSVLKVANAIRLDGDGLVQTRGRMEGPADAVRSVIGTANIFILPIDERRDQRISQVRSWASERTSDPAWNDAEASSVKVLIVVHRMAAKRLGFGVLYQSLNDKAPERFKNGFLDGTAWPLRPFVRFVMPLVTAIKKNNEFDVIQLLRSQSPKLARENVVGIDIAELLSRLRRVTQTVATMMEPGSGFNVAQVLTEIYQSEIFPLDPRILTYLKLGPPTDSTQLAVERTTDGDDEVTKEVSAMDAFLACDASQFWGYYEYLNDESPFSTQQGIKGAEFNRVLVVLDDDEGTHTQFSYDKYFGIRELSDRDKDNLREGKETAVERTRRLFYVSCTRALKDLVVVLFASDVAAAHRQIVNLRQFPAEAIHLEDELARVY
jgi:DNA helicase-2/ATP-dependent DNA helicase PcrA